MQGPVFRIRNGSAGGGSHGMPTRTFSFGLWTLMNAGADPFGAPTRAPLDALHAISGLAAHSVGAFELHAEDLIPSGSSGAERDRMIREARARMADTGIVCDACGSSLFTEPVFKDGALVSNEARVRSLALARYKDAIDVGHLLGAPLFDIWGGRDGSVVQPGRTPSALCALTKICGSVGRG